MADLRTTYLGLELTNPLVVAACSLCTKMENLHLCQRFGAGAVVLRSLFEEQILADRAHLDDALAVASEAHAEALDYIPPINHADAEDYLRLCERARADLHIPVIGSLNAVSSGSWTRHAKQIEETGVDALELNVYAVSTDPTRSAADLENELFDLVESVLEEVSIPVAVKLSPFYTALPNVVAECVQRGAKGAVLFNRFLQPDIDANREVLTHSMALSTSSELRLPLRHIALLYGRVSADLACSTGIHRGEDVVKALLAGSTITQVAGALIKNGIHHLATLIRDLEARMDERGYDTIDDLRGTVSQQSVSDPFAFERAQYVTLLAEGKGHAPLNARVN